MGTSVTLELEPIIQLLSSKVNLFNDTVPNESDSDSSGSGQSPVVRSCQHKVPLVFLKGGESEMFLNSDS